MNVFPGCCCEYAVVVTRGVPVQRDGPRCVRLATGVRQGHESSRYHGETVPESTTVEEAHGLARKRTTETGEAHSALDEATPRTPVQEGKSTESRPRISLTSLGKMRKRRRAETAEDFTENVLCPAWLDTENMVCPVSLDAAAVGAKNPGAPGKFGPCIGSGYPLKGLFRLTLLS